MKNFNDQDFMLQNEVAKKLYHGVAEHLPIFDFHCHLPIEEIYADRTYDSITDLWLVEKKNGKAFGDHYKWRLMRAHGVDEAYITGDKDKKEKFLKWADTLQNAFLNPLYHWSHLELKQYFDIDEPLTSENAERIYDLLNEKLKSLSVRKLLIKANVHTLYTTDDPLSDLHYHQLLKQDKSFKVVVNPAFRADNFIKIYAPNYADVIKALGEVTHKEIKDIRALEEALDERLAYFAENGCRAFDVSFEDFLYQRASIDEVDVIFKKALNHEELTQSDLAKYYAEILHFFGKACSKYHFVMQYHLKALRNLNSKAYETLGADSGYDAISDTNLIHDLTHCLDDLEKEDALYKTIIYTLDLADYEPLLAMCGSFQKAPYRGKIQFGAAWWFNDHRDGMEKQMRTLADYSLLPHFVGMLTDSRSFLSYARHDYFRRLLCNLIGKTVEDGEYPLNEKFLEKMVKDISFDNAVEFFTKD